MKSTYTMRLENEKKGVYCVPFSWDVDTPEKFDSCMADMVNIRNATYKMEALIRADYDLS